MASEIPYVKITQTPEDPQTPAKNKHSMRAKPLVVCAVGVLVLLCYWFLVRSSSTTVPQPMYSPDYGLRDHVAPPVHNVHVDRPEQDEDEPETSKSATESSKPASSSAQSSPSSSSNKTSKSPSSSPNSPKSNTETASGSESLNRASASVSTTSKSNTPSANIKNGTKTANADTLHPPKENEQDTSQEAHGQANDGHATPVTDNDKGEDKDRTGSESHNPENEQLKVPDTTPAEMSLEERFQLLLRQTADSKGLIYLSSVDNAYLPMAINLYKTSYKRLGIKNYLIVCSDDKAHETLKKNAINSFKYLEDSASDVPVIYGTKEFRRKTHLKTKIILDALLVGLTVIIVDVDIIFFKDPVPYLTCQDCDIQIQSDVSEGNSGFYMVRPTEPSINLHKTAWIKAQTSGESISNQKLLDRAMESMQRAHQIKYKTLDANLFPSGFVYFETKVRMFYSDNPPQNEVILHNNWIVSMEAKRYRFKELLWWHVDGGYYSDPARKYMTYENPRDFGTASTQRQETDALISALIISHILNRTLILPSFTCHNCKYGACRVNSHKCTFNTHYMIATFDSVLGEGTYREHVFLKNPLVPESIKTPSPVHAIQSSELGSTPPEVKLLQPSDVAGPTGEDIRHWFAANSDPVLRIHSMYGILGNLRKEAIYSKIKSAINEHTDYRQYHL